MDANIVNELPSVDAAQVVHARMWIVSYFDNTNPGRITVTAFDNYEAADKMYRFECESEKHYTVSLDEAPIYSSYYAD